ncbi:MAG: BTAD domain-containing putative transcriptional regulator [Actinomycetota bacterium]|nr:BTAD domain-containing putative transcriptional regulator [Actinomycetota bacterium]
MLGLHSGSVVPADTLVELLWGQDPPRTAAKALQTHISSLRRTLGDGFVVTQGAGWTLAESEVDAARYKSTARLGREAAAAGDTSQALARFDEALALWRGAPELPDGRRGTSERTRWVESHAALVEDRADALLATGRAAEVIGDLEGAVADAPLRERRWGQLMLALYRAGRQGEALGAYQRARSLLADDLGVDPGPELRRLEAAIVTQDASLDIAVAQSAPSVTRAVTFLLTDIEGSTAAWEADAGAMAVALARHDELVEQVVTSRGGRLIKTRGEGDATFSVFDRPSAGVAAAIELQDAIAHEPWASRDPIRVRMALHTGEVELRDGDYFGRAVNRVARLRSLAEGGQILCSGATAELVIDSLADDVMLTDLGMRQLKNLARPEHVFELRLETGADQSDSPAPEMPMERPNFPAVLVGPGPFVGRGRELEGLLSAWQTALAGGVRAVLIAGEPGVGKTRLAGEWSQQAYAQGAVVLYGRCDEDLGAPYQPFAEALRSLAPCVGADRLRAVRGVEALLSLVPGLADVVPDLTPPAHADPDTERYALFDAVVALLEIASKSAPVVMIVDDLHWAAKPTLLLLRHLLRFGDHARVQIVGTYRSTDLDRSHPLAATLADLHRDGTANRLTLSGLDEDDVTAYVAEAGYDDEELAHALASVTGGNPFFLIEALRHVDESGGVWDQSTLPQGVREAVSRRLSRLPADTNKALAAAAVVGSRFALDLVEQVVGTDLIDAFDEARQAGIVIEEPGGYYRFNHAIVRQSLLAELASVRRMRLHQRIATTLETLPGADDELLAELAHHYFECAWAGNAAKAAFYCRRAADQAMARLAYEGAADLYDHALHALEDIDDELPDRDDQTVELLVARCEALLAAGDVAPAAGAVSQLQTAAADSARLAAWATCFDGQLSMLIHPERLDEVEIALGAAAAKLAELDDAAGEAKAHTVRAGCLARLGRIGDCEIALDDALTAARRAREHRRVNAVLAGAPLAALWGPNPVPRAGGRCLDVVRLLRITTDSPAVEATSTRCQAVLEAFRGRTAAARRMIDSARRTLTELGLRHALLEVEQFAGIVELIGNDAAAAESHLRKAYNGFRRMGLDADTAETAALLGRGCLALGRDDEARELCSESERLAGHALKASIAWRTLRAHLLARDNDFDAARRVAEEAVSLAERTDALVDHGDACLTLATVLGAAGDIAGARAAAERAVDLYERKGAAALADVARQVLGEPAQPPTPAPPEVPVVELDSECVRVGERVMAAIHRKDWDEFERLFAPNVSIENRRKIVGVDHPSDAGRREVRRELEAGATRIDYVMVAARGERLALSRLMTSTVDESPGAPHDELLQLYAIDENGQVVRQVWFDVDDMDAAMAELDAAYARLEHEHVRRLENSATRAYERLHAYFKARDWEAIAELLTDDYCGDDRRSVVGSGIRRGPDAAIEDYRSAADIDVTDASSETVATRGERLALTRARYARSTLESETFRVDFLQIVELDADDRIAAMAAFDLDDFDAAIAELDARYLAGEAAPHAHTWSVITRALVAHNLREVAAATPDAVTIDHRRAVAFAPGEGIEYLRAGWNLDQNLNLYVETVHRLNDVGAVFTWAGYGTSHEGFDAAWRAIDLMTIDGEMISRVEVFDEADLDAALARFEQLDAPAPRMENAAARVFDRVWSHFATRDWDAMAEMVSDDYVGIDHRRIVSAETQHGRNEVIRDLQAAAGVGFTLSMVSAIAIRGDRLVLARTRATGRDPDVAQDDALNVVGIDADDRIASVVSYDVEDFDAAIAELEAQYLAGEGAVHARTWCAVARSYAALNRHELPSTTPDCVNIDHRHETAFGPGDLNAYIRAGWDAEQDINVHVEQVHRLRDTGAIVTYAAHEIAREGLRAEWRGIAVFTVEGDMINRTEVFDESDLDAAIARFEELHPEARRRENAASQIAERFFAYFAARDWGSISATLAENVSHYDRRHVVNAGVLHGRDAQISNLRAIAEVGVTTFSCVVNATRSTHLALIHTRSSGRDQATEGVLTEELGVVEINSENRMAAFVAFDIDDFDAAVAELDARYIAGEAAPYSHAWSVITRAYAALNRREHPLTTADWSNIDHRRGVSFAPGETSVLIANWDATHGLRSFVEAVHRLNDLGAVVTSVTHETSDDGFHAEWRVISLLTIEGDLIDRLEVFDESDLDAAIARFEQLTMPTPQLQNAASRANKRFQETFAARDWAALAQGLGDNVSHDDRRRVVGMGVRHGRDAMIAEARALEAIGVTNATSDVIAIRGQRLVFSRIRTWGRDQRPEAFHTDALDIVEIDASERIVARVVFDVDDIDTAFNELEIRYMTGEAATYADTWAAVAGVHATFNRHEFPPEDWVTIDHRRGTLFAADDMTSAVHSIFDLTPNFHVHIEQVHKLSRFGALITNCPHGSSPDGLDVEWRMMMLLIVDGDRLSRCEVFDENDLDAANARFDELSRPASRLSNVTTRVIEQFLAHFSSRDWNAMAELLADDFFSEDRRRVLNAGTRHGRDAEMANWLATSDVWMSDVRATVVATRGAHLALFRFAFASQEQEPEAFQAAALGIGETNDDNRVTASIVFDVDDVDAAFEELDARYLAGEAAAYSRTWSAIAAGYAALNRHEVPSTTRDWVNVDHRRGISFAVGELAPYIRATFDVAPDIKIRIDFVHRLTSHGAVVSYSGHGTSQDGFDAVWRETALFIVDGDLVSRCEMYEEADVDAALARFEELQPQARQLENSASPILDRYQAYFSAPDWGAMAELLADDLVVDDRRRVVNAGVRRGRDLHIADLRAAVEVGAKTISLSLFATRGERLALVHARAFNRDMLGEVGAEWLGVVEIDAGERIVAMVIFDTDDIDAALAELDARYLCGDAAAYLRTWTVITRGYSRVNRHELPGMTPESVLIDHRAVLTTESEGLAGYLPSLWDLMPDISVYIEAVHRLTDKGAVITQAAHGTSQEGFDAEWRAIVIGILEGDLYTRVEVFDEADLDAALARFEELSRPAQRLENAATHVYEHLLAYYEGCDWAAMTEILSEDLFSDDRRRVVGGGVRRGQEALVEDLRAVAAVEVTHAKSVAVAIRGTRLALTHARYSRGHAESEAFYVDYLQVVEISGEARITALVAFDPEDIDAATEELETRYLAGEAAAHKHTWSTLLRSFTAFNEHQLPSTTPDWVNLDHRRGRAFSPGDLVPYIHATWQVMPQAKIYVDAIHRLSNLGAVVTQSTHGTSPDGFDAEWHEATLLTLEGDLINRIEVFDEADLDAALARFDELEAQTPRVENAASRILDRCFVYFRDRNWTAIAGILTDDSFIDDRRRVTTTFGFWDGRDAVLANLRALADAAPTTWAVIATRGERLALTRICSPNRDVRQGEFSSDMLILAEIDGEARIAAQVAFDVEDIDAAFEDLENRYLAGEAAAQARTWSAIVENYAALNRGQLPSTTADFVDIDHRRGASMTPGQLMKFVRSALDQTPDLTIRIVTVHRLSQRGAVVTHAATGRSPDGFEAEWQEVSILTVGGDRLNCIEVFDEADLEAALARFDELTGEDQAK